MKTLPFLLLIPMLLFSQRPDWVGSTGKSIRYPNQLYLTGFGLCKVNKEFDQTKSMQRALSDAQGNLIQSIRVNIQSTVGSTVIERESKISSYFSNATQSSSTMELQGLESETYYDDDDEVSLALAFISRSKTTSIYREKEKSIQKEIRQHLDAGKRFEEQGERTKALNEYQACFPFFLQLQEAQAIIMVASTAIDKGMNELEGQVEKDEVNKSTVQEAIDRLKAKPINSPEDLAWYLADGLHEQSDLRSASVLVYPFVYQDTKIGSPFSRYFKNVLESKLVEVAKWTPVQQLEVDKPRTRNITLESAKASDAEYIVKGSYWIQERGIKLIVSLLRIQDGKIVGSVEKVVSDSTLKNTGQSLMPPNLEQALADEKKLAQGEEAGAGLTIDVWTNRGAEDLVFTKGDRMRVFVRVNLPCYIRFIYHLADGKRTVLERNHYIDESKVNKEYHSPQWEFECDEPYGVERLQVFASTEEFSPIETEYINGYYYLKEDLGDFLLKQRGMKKVKKGVMNTEARLAVTTMER
ncbi:MAG: DUF4384 domain-containing protein [bacterium]